MCSCDVCNRIINEGEKVFYNEVITICIECCKETGNETTCIYKGKRKSI
jgi:hypothetical protein